MPLIQSDYRPPWYWRNPHLQTILPNRLRRVGGVDYEVESVPVDGEVTDLYWSRCGADSVAVVAHGLGGHVFRPYVKGMVKALNEAGWDACAWHVWNTDRAASPHFYHGGSTEGVRSIVERIRGYYRRVALVGFSLGGNVVLKYLGEEGGGCRVDRAVTFSVPCDLGSSCERLAEPSNRIYNHSFLKTLKAGIREKARHLPDRVSIDGLEDVRTLFDYDDRFTAPLNGFDGADDYYRQSSSAGYLDGIQVPTLMVSAANDPFLTPACYPTEICEGHSHVSLEVPASGGHVGFPLGRGRYWSEERAVAFLEEREG